MESGGMALVPARGAHSILAESNPGSTHRLAGILSESNMDEILVRKEIDALAFDGQIERLYVGEHVMVKKTEEFNSDYQVSDFT
jgi:hypothetical protein